MLPTAQGSTIAGWALLPGLLLAVACGSCADPPGADTANLPQRIVVMAPAAAEMLDALGALDRVVGVGDFVRGPLALDALPHIGAYNAPNIERVLALRPDLYVTTLSSAAADAHRRLEALGIRVLELDTSTYDGVFASLAELGSRIGRPVEARALEQALDGRIALVRDRAAGLPSRRVLVVVGRDPLYVAGPGSHLDEMIRLAGGHNVAHDTTSPYPRFSMEAVLERMPEVIVDVSDNAPSTPRGRIPGDWARWPFLPAVREDRVYQVDPSRLTIPGMQLPEMTLLMGRLVHPQVFGEAALRDLAAP